MMVVVSSFEYPGIKRKGGGNVTNLIGKTLDIVLDLGDGREYRLDNGLIRSIEISQSMEGLAEFDLGITGPALRQVSPTTEIKIQGIVTGDFTDLFNYDPDEKKIEETGLIHGKHYCAFCGSDWIPCSRGNCGACGGDKHRGRTED